VAPAAHPLAKRIHDRVLQLIGTAMIKAEMAEQLELLGRHSDVAGALTVVELRSIMAELRTEPADDSLKNQAA
jgi:hypothetical protein